MLTIARTLESEGFETWCVGGAVRDALLGHPHLDWDLATAATPQQVRRLFRRTIPVGIEFGTVGVLDEHGTMHEVTTFRRDVQTDGRHAVVEFGASLDDDLARRDFTINAMAYSTSSKVLHDPFGGREDLARGIIRAVGAADDRMREDRLRALRAIRFAARFHFEIEADTWQAIVRSAPHMRRLSMERVKQELEKTMEQVECPSRSLALWRDSGALGVLITPLGQISEVTLAALDEMPPPGAGRPERPDRRMNRFIALFSDLEPAVAERAVRALRFSNADVAWITSVLERWRMIDGELRSALLGAEHEGMRPGASVGAAAGVKEAMAGVGEGDQEGLTALAGTPASGTIRRWVGVMGRTRARSVLRLAAARFAAARTLGLPAPPAARMRTLYHRALRIALRDPVEISDLAIDGDDLRMAGIPAGPSLGWILRQLLDGVLEDPARNTRAWLTERAVELYRSTSR